MNRRAAMKSDEGVSLILALVFITVVGLFATVALTKSATVSGSGVSLRTRANLQYALDGSVENVYSTLSSELASGSPVSCTTVAGGTTSFSFSLNSQSVHSDCTTLAGRAKTTSDAANTNFALVVTSPSPSALITGNAVNRTVNVDGSVYLNGKVTNSDLQKNVTVSTGDIVSPNSRTNCSADLLALTQLATMSSSQLKVCTDQTVADAQPPLALPDAPTVDLAPALKSGIDNPSHTCRVFYPGLYKQAPVLDNAANYFVSGLYYFEDVGTWDIDNDSEVTGGARSVSSDSAVPNNGCKTMNDTTALGFSAFTALPATTRTAISGARFSYGSTIVLGGSSVLNFKKGAVTLFTPPSGGINALSFVGFPDSGVPSSIHGYKAMTTGSDSITGGTNHSVMEFNGKLFAPTTKVTVFSTNNTTAAVRGGVIAYTVDLSASASGSGGVAISATSSGGTPPPPFRTVKVVSNDASGTSTATNTAVATVSNFPPYRVDVLSWRTE
jgi:hypothetical protein